MWVISPKSSLKRIHKLPGPDCACASRVPLPALLGEIFFPRILNFFFFPYRATPRHVARRRSLPAPSPEGWGWQLIACAAREREENRCAMPSHVYTE